VTVSLFSMIGWTAVAVAPIFVTCVFVSMLASLFAVRLYSELRRS
jgi:hypothetical protein